MKKIGILTAIIALFCISNSYAAAPVDSMGTWALWHMNARTNWVDPPALPWYVNDDASANPGRTNDMAMDINNSIVGDGVYGNCIYFDGDSRAISVNGWDNSDTFKLDFYIKPEDIDNENQKLFEITQALSVRFSRNTAYTHGRILFYIYDGGVPYLVTSGWGTLDVMTSQWNHVTTWVDYDGKFCAFLNGVSGETNSVSGIDDAYPTDPRAFIGGSRIRTDYFTGSIDEMKVSVIPEPFLFINCCFGLWIIYSRRPLEPGSSLSL